MTPGGVRGATTAVVSLIAGATSNKEAVTKKEGKRKKKKKKKKKAKKGKKRGGLSSFGHRFSWEGTA